MSIDESGNWWWNFTSTFSWPTPCRSPDDAGVPDSELQVKAQRTLPEQPVLPRDREAPRKAGAVGASAAAASASADWHSAAATAPASTSRSWPERLLSTVLPGESRDLSGKLERDPSASDPFWVLEPSRGGARAGAGAGSDSAFSAALLPGRCMSDAVAAVNMGTDDIVPDAEIMSIQLQTREQRLDWRDFLCEAVAGNKTALLYRLYSTEADSPEYARPPRSLPRKADPTHSSPGLASSAPCPKIVAPRGAGWRLPDGNGRTSPPSSPVSSLRTGATAGGKSASGIGAYEAIEPLRKTEPDSPSEVSGSLEPSDAAEKAQAKPDDTFLTEGM
eukprot:TRINITY_DN10737_c0_g1_i1.p1 TRINITY_DN10737_c0_g1~~TRINITY_DN10737_c0_g1_i1.p1  ORF type:complete len:333 (-),score=62.53 TRINITY_DN10737_c0_g1_i1:101-1099(-)